MQNRSGKAKEVFQRFDQVISTSRLNNAVANFVAPIYYTDSNMLHDRIKFVKAIDNVSRVFRNCQGCKYEKP
jgi:hypothetical protein